MGEPGDDELFKDRVESARDGLPVDHTAEIAVSRSDRNQYQSIVVAKLQDLNAHAEEHAGKLDELIEAVNNNTRAVAALVKAVGGNRDEGAKASTASS